MDQAHDLSLLDNVEPLDALRGVDVGGDQGAAAFGLPVIVGLSPEGNGAFERLNLSLENQTTASTGTDCHALTLPSLGPCPDWAAEPVRTCSSSMGAANPHSADRTDVLRRAGAELSSQVLWASNPQPPRGSGRRATRLSG
jgi:hypothetical protein